MKRQLAMTFKYPKGCGDGRFGWLRVCQDFVCSSPTCHSISQFAD
jgi:hypothetical protein